MLRSVDHIITGVGTLAIGVIVIWIRGAMIPISKSKENSKKHKKKILENDDLFYSVRFGRDAHIEHNGSCHCEEIRFSVWAPRKLQAVDTNGDLNSKKGRYAHIIIPLSSLKVHVDTSKLGMYIPTNSQGQHFFCKNCAVHVFHLNPDHPNVVDINVHCMDETNISELSVILIPESYPAPFSKQKSNSMPEKINISCNETNEDESMTFHGSSNQATSVNGSCTSSPASNQYRTPVKRTNTLEDSLVLWSQLGPHKHESESKFRGSNQLANYNMSNQQQEDTENSITNSHAHNIANMKSQLKRYLQHHLQSNHAAEPEEEGL